MFTLGYSHDGKIIVLRNLEDGTAVHIPRDVDTLRNIADMLVDELTELDPDGFYVLEEFEDVDA